MQKFLLHFFFDCRFRYTENISNILKGFEEQQEIGKNSANYLHFWALCIVWCVAIFALLSCNWNKISAVCAFQFILCRWCAGDMLVSLKAERTKKNVLKGFCFVMKCKSRESRSRLVVLKFSSFPKSSSLKFIL